MSLANIVRRHVTPTCIAEGIITVTLIQFFKFMEMILILLLFYPSAYLFYIILLLLYVIVTFSTASHNVSCFNCFQLNILCKTKKIKQIFCISYLPHCIHSYSMCKSMSYFLSILILFQK